MSKEIRENINKIKNINENPFEHASRDEYKNAYIKRINKEYNGLLTKVVNNPNFEFILGIDIISQETGTPNRCETNTYKFIKENLLNGVNHFYPVGGYFFGKQSLMPIEHWWVYNKNNNTHIEITPMGEHKPWAYGGVINYDIHKEILKANDVYDVSFFLGDNSYINYFK